MYKKIIKTLLLALFLVSSFYSMETFGAAVTIPDAKEIRDVSIGDSVVVGQDPIYAINEIGFSILTTLKLALQ